MPAASTSSNINIHTAALQGQAGLVRTVLDSNPDLLYFKDSDGRTPLHYAASSSSLPVLHVLLEAAGGVGGSDTEQYKKWIDGGDSLGWGALHIAASAGSPEVVSELLGAGANANIANDKGITPLHYAASKGNVQVGRLLISKGADINARDRANQLPLHRACTTGSTAFVRLLVSPPPPSSSSSSSPSQPSSFSLSQSQSAAQQQKPRLNLQDRAGNTPLHLAIESGHGECAVVLIEAGADRDRTNADGQRAEEIEGVGGQEAKKVRNYIESRCGKLDE